MKTTTNPKEARELQEVNYWCYRIMRQSTPHGDVCHIHEVYFDKMGTPLLVSPPCHPVGEDREALVEDLKLMREAFKKNVLDYDEWREDEEN